MAEQKHAVSIGTGAVTDQSLAAAPGVGFRIVVESYSLSVGVTAAANVELKFSATNREQFRLAINGHAERVALNWKGDANTALVLTTSANGPTDVTVHYHVEPIG